MKYFTLDLDGEEINFRLTSSDSVELEKRTGVKLLDYIQDYSMVTITNLLKYMRKSSVPNFSDKDAYALFDKLVDNGYSLEDIETKIIMETCVVSGFLKQSDLEEILDKKETKRKELQATQEA
jgi:hypothetical protein